MKRETLNTPCCMMLLITGIIVAVALACMMPHPAYADDAELAQLQAQIDQTAADYDQAADRVAQLQQQLQDNQDRIDEISGQLPEQQERSNDAVKALYLVQQEGFGLLNMVLSSQNLTEFLNAVDYIDCIQQHNAAQVTKLADMKADLRQRKRRSRPMSAMHPSPPTAPLQRWPMRRQPVKKRKSAPSSRRPNRRRTLQP